MAEMVRKTHDRFPRCSQASCAVRHGEIHTATALVRSGVVRVVRAIARSLPVWASPVYWRNFWR